MQDKVIPACFSAPLKALRNSDDYQNDIVIRKYFGQDHLD